MTGLPDFWTSGLLKNSLLTVMTGLLDFWTSKKLPAYCNDWTSGLLKKPLFRTSTKPLLIVMTAHPIMSVGDDNFGILISISR